MRDPCRRLVGLTVAMTVTLARSMAAQGVSTASISGSVLAADSTMVNDAFVVVLNLATGVASRAAVRQGRFIIGQLEVGGPYSISVRSIGYGPQDIDGIHLSLGQTLRVNFWLVPDQAELPPVVVTALPPLSATGLATTISDSMLRRLPTADRDLYAFVQLNPNVSLANGLGPSGGGANFRFNNYVIDGVTQQSLFGRAPAGGGEPISLAAVKEYQILLSPYEVWQGGFAGARINTVTMSGTNAFHGGAYVNWRNEQLASEVPLLRDAPYARTQYGFSLGGPVVRDRVHFFLAPEFQQQSAPAPGPYVGQAATSPVRAPVDAEQVARFNRALAAYGLLGGSAGPVSNTQSLANLFARLDVALPSASSRIVLSYNYSASSRGDFLRSAAYFPLTSFAWTRQSSSNALTGQLLSRFGGGGENQLSISWYDQPFNFVPAVLQPLTAVIVPRVGGSGEVQMLAGTAIQADIRQGQVEIADRYSRPLGGAHLLTLGGLVDFYRIGGADASGSFGDWTFASLDSLELGVASRFAANSDFGGAEGSFTGVEYSAYAADQWQVTRRLSLVAGLRLDLPVVNGHPPYVPGIDSIFGRRTDVVPSGRAMISPRAGFNWDISGDGRGQLRGGVGVFTGRPPMSWWLGAFRNYGQTRMLLCAPGEPGSAGPPPAFDPDHAHPPTTCANGQGYAMSPAGQVDLLDAKLTYPRTLRASLAYDRRLPWEITGSLEGMYTKGITDFAFLNTALAGPQGTDRFGRVMYGSINTDGIAQPALKSAQYPNVTNLMNQSKNYAYALSIRFSKPFSNRLEATVSYTYARAFDASSPSDPNASDNWQTARTVSGYQDVLTAETSAFDQPHRLVLAGTYTLPWHRWTTAISGYYVGGSGAPFTLTTDPYGSTGDLNADGSSFNDPIYIPTNAADPEQIRFDGTPGEIAAQQLAFEEFISRMPCLARQRGHIMARNSCRSPWVNTLNLSLRQAIPLRGAHSLALELQVFNFLSLIRREWGLLRTPATTGILTQVGQTPGPPTQSQPVFSYDPGATFYTSEDPASYYQLQLVVRYGF